MPAVTPLRFLRGHTWATLKHIRRVLNGPHRDFETTSCQRVAYPLNGVFRRGRGWATPSVGHQPSGSCHSVKNGIEGCGSDTANGQVAECMPELTF